jgi:hypothetical protein
LQAFQYSLPWTVGGGVQYHLGARGTINAEFIYTTWASANDELIAAGGVGSENTFSAALGAELVTSKVEGKFPLRLGLRTRQLPFLLEEGQQPSEFSVSAGTGGRFAKGRAAYDLALQRLWRTSDGGFSEDAWVLTFGLTLKP